MTKFTEELYSLAKPIWKKSHEHPFVQELVAGTLTEKQFRYYLLQDCYYLIHFSKAHELLADKTDNQAIREIQLSCQAGLQASEIDIRDMFFETLNITDEEYQQMIIAPTAYQYVNHIYRHVFTGSVETAIASLLPCYWLYNELGQTFVEKGSPVPLYQEWIETYDSEGFSSVTQTQIDLVDRLAEQASDETRAKMKEAFLISSQYELNFWEMSYQIETWDYLK